MLHSRRTPLFAQLAYADAGAHAGREQQRSLRATVVADGKPADAKTLRLGARIRHRF